MKKANCCTEIWTVTCNTNNEIGRKEEQRESLFFCLACTIIIMMIVYAAFTNTTYYWINGWIGPTAVVDQYPHPKGMMVLGLDLYDTKLTHLNICTSVL
jgi:hypothetical protein